jgi:hypothetical protein
MRRIATSPVRASLVAAGMASAMVLGACSLGTGGPGPSADQSIPHPAGEAPVLRVGWEGGFVMPNTHLVSLPNFLMTGDGRVFTLGAVAAVYPGPALPPVIVRQLSEDGVQAVLREVLDSRQFEFSSEWTGASSMVADAADTVFALNAARRDVVVRVYALGTLDADALPPGMTASERGAHRALAALEQRLITLDDWLPRGAWVEHEWQAYLPKALRLLVRNADNDEPDASGIQATEVAWPIAGDPEAFGSVTSLDGYRCGVVVDANAEAWWDALMDANQLTRWDGGGHSYEVTPRPLLPGEAEECPAR